MRTLKKFLGLIWLLAGPGLFIFLVLTALHYINAEGKGEIGNPVPWLIIILIFAPIAAGLSIFGWYCLQNEYGKDELGEPYEG
jgi:hypothetical protein